MVVLASFLPEPSAHSAVPSARYLASHFFLSYCLVKYSLGILLSNVLVYYLTMMLTMVINRVWFMNEWSSIFIPLVDISYSSKILDFRLNLRSNRMEIRTRDSIFPVLAKQSGSLVTTWEDFQKILKILIWLRDDTTSVLKNNWIELEIIGGRNRFIFVSFLL